jgi:predicted PhzF superfamily epimerase YddE/YHI9
MPTIPVFQVDAFADRPFTGNPAAVCPLTPTVEVPLCGHATLASAYIVMTALAPGRERVVFRTRESGALTVTRDGTGFALDFPAHLRWQPGDPGPAAAALGAMPLEVVVSEHRMLLARFEAAQAGKRTKPGSAKT